ncbi:MAG: hypothetical protein OCD02_08455 [Spirochaetaceae bacterium]
MKKFIKVFFISLLSSGIILTITYLFSFTPLDQKNGSFFSNGFIIGLVIVFIGIFKLQSGVVNHREDILYGVHEDMNDTSVRKMEEFNNSQIPGAIGFILAGAINLALSVFF